MIDTTFHPTGPGTGVLGRTGVGGGRLGAAARAGAVLAATLLFCWMALWNGQPFLHPDSPSYVRGAETAVTTLFGDRFATEWTAPASSTASGAAPGATADGEVGGGRSIAYGLLAWLGAVAGGFWLTVLVQALAAAVLLEAVLRALGRGGLIPYAAVAALLAFATPLPFFTGFVMPDIWAGLAIGALAALFAFPDRLTRGDGLRLGSLIVFAALAHNSVVLILLALTAAGGSIAFVRGSRGPRPWAGLLAGAMAVAAALAAALVFNTAVERTTGRAPVMPPFLTARVIADGPGLRYVRERCGEAEFEVCLYADKLPLPVDAFLWSPTRGVFSNASPESRRELSAEQTRFALAVFSAYPAEQIAASARNAAAQLVRADLEDFEYLPPFMADMTPRVAEPHRSRFQSVRAIDAGLPLAALERIYAAAALLCLIGAAVLLSRRPAGEVRPEAALFFALVAVGLLANAAVCGALSALHGRYQARVLWLLPLAFAALAATAGSLAGRKAVAP
ncbi:MAG: hypothetical protein M3M95_03090 [Pseudomonadota bacterium]|nr:hypothetical protein [Pseudomonadota bacterium]